MGDSKLIAGKYQLQCLIDKGGMGEVWRAVNLQIDREVAIKLIKPAAEELKLGTRLIREAKVIGGLRHSNIVEVLDAGEMDGEPYLVMELLIGETLRNLLDRRFMLEPTATAQIGRCVASALTAAHEAQIVHRDLKPANIFLHRKPGVDGVIVKVVDFGISKRLDGNDRTLTAPDKWVGTMPYMSPEQLLTPKKVDPRSDIWSLGVVMFELLTGVKPFQTDQGGGELLVRILRAEIPRVSDIVRDVPPGLDDIVSRCLVRDREQRIGAARELAEQLQKFAGPGDTLRIYSGPITHVFGTSRVQSMFDRTVGEPDVALADESAMSPAASRANQRFNSGGSELMVDPFKLAAESPGALKYAPPAPLSRPRATQVEAAIGAPPRAPQIDSALIDEALESIDTDTTDERETNLLANRQPAPKSTQDQRSPKAAHDARAAESVQGYSLEIVQPIASGDRGGLDANVGRGVAPSQLRSDHSIQPVAPPTAAAPSGARIGSEPIQKWRAQLDRIVSSDAVAVSSVVVALVVVGTVGTLVFRSKFARATELLRGNPVAMVEQQSRELLQRERASRPAAPAPAPGPVASPPSPAPSVRSPAAPRPAAPAPAPSPVASPPSPAPSVRSPAAPRPAAPAPTTKPVKKCGILLPCKKS